jgi:hypothetical protein
MCIQGLSPLLMENEKLQNALAVANLDLIHQQVLMTLYSMDVDNRLNECQEILPLYLSQPWDTCLEILHVLETSGLIKCEGEQIVLAYPIKRPDDELSCACHGSCS